MGGTARGPGVSDGPQTRMRAYEALLERPPAGTA